MAFVTGTYLGPYEILSPLGSGGMGEVYRAKDPRLEREVAVKVLPERLAKDGEALARFERETKVLASLSHPNILTIYDVGHDQDLYYAVMELLVGESLRIRIDRSPLPWDKAVEIASAIADGLSAAHSRGVIHRDLKPENVFLTSDGRVKILDFGLARWEPPISVPEGSAFPTAAGGTTPGTLMGTIGYMPPEQVRGQQADARSDIFSFGCILHEMLTGKGPFHRNTAPETIAAILKEDPLPVSEPGKEVPAEVDRVIRYCLEKRPEQRFQTAQDLSFALKMISSGSGTWKGTSWKEVTPKQTRRKSRKSINSLAILPLANAGGDPEAEYMADGITESIINILSHLPKLRVTARSSAFRYKGKETDPQTIGRELDVRAVLTGRVVQRGDILNIQTELVDVSDGSQLWGEQYNRKLSDIFSLQEEIAKQISERLRLKLIREEKKKLAKRATENTEAYKLYLKGRYHWNKRTLDGFQQAIDYFQLALQEDPKFALAYSGLSDTYGLMGGFGYVPSGEAYEKARAEATKALSLDETLAEAHNSLATVKYRYDWDWAGAEAEFQKAILYNPNYEFAHHWYGVYLALMGRIQEAIVELDRALALDPLSLVSNWSKGYVLYYARQHDAALEQCRKALAVDPTFHRIYVDIGLIYLQKSMFEEGIREIQKAMLTEVSPAALSSLAYAYALAGQKEETQRILRDLLEQSRRRYISSFMLAIVYTGLGEIDRAFEYLEKSFEAREDAIPSIKMNPRLDPLRSDPRFAVLLRRIGLS